MTATKEHYHTLDGFYIQCLVIQQVIGMWAVMIGIKRPYGIFDIVDSGNFSRDKIPSVISVGPLV